MSMDPFVAPLMGEVRQGIAQLVDEQLTFMKDVVEDHQYDQLQEDIEMVQDLQLSVAIRIGPITWLRTRRGYRAAGELPQEELDAMNALIDDMVTAMSIAVRYKNR